MIEDKIDDIIHIFLRNMVAHAEAARKNNKKYKDSFEDMYEKYKNLKFSKLFKVLDILLKKIRTEIQNFT